MRLLKKTTCIILILSIMVSLTGCSLISEPKDPPEATIQRFVSALRELDFNTMVQVFDPLKYEQEEITLEDFIGFAEDDQNRMVAEAFVDYMFFASGKIEHEVIDSNVEGKRAVATVRFRYIDSYPYIADSYTQYVAYIIGLNKRTVAVSEEAVLRRLGEIFKENVGKHEDQFVEEIIEIPMVARLGEWYIEEYTDDLINITASGIIKAIHRIEEEDFLAKKHEELMNSAE